jgi:hypothetical protein
MTEVAPTVLANDFDPPHSQCGVCDAFHSVGYVVIKRRPATTRVEFGASPAQHCRSESACQEKYNQGARNEDNVSLIR